MMLLSPGLSALTTTAGLVGQAFGGKELLFPGGKSEGSPTIGTLNRLILKTHWMTSFFKIFSWSLGHPILDMNLAEF